MKCSICGKEIKGHGHNPCPLQDSEGRYLTVEEQCCDECNTEYVIPARFAQLTSDDEKLELIQKQVNRLRGVDVKPVKGKKHLIALIERPDGSTYEQEISYRSNDTIQTAVERAQKGLGNKYRFYVDKHGKRRRVINNKAYVIVDTFIREDK